MRIAFIAVGAMATLAVQGLIRTVGVAVPSTDVGDLDSQETPDADPTASADPAAVPFAIAQPETLPPAPAGELSPQGKPATKAVPALVTFAGAAGVNTVSAKPMALQSRSMALKPLPKPQTNVKRTLRPLAAQSTIRGAASNFAGPNSTAQVADASMRTAIQQMYGTAPRTAAAPAMATAPAASAPKPLARAMFSDLQGHPAQRAVEYLVQTGVTQGYADGTFGANEPISDMQFNRWMKAAFNWTSPSTFQRPRSVTTRAQAAAFIYQKLQIAQSINRSGQTTVVAKPAAPALPTLVTPTAIAPMPVSPSAASPMPTAATPVTPVARPPLSQDSRPAVATPKITDPTPAQPTVSKPAAAI